MLNPTASDISLIDRLLSESKAFFAGVGYHAQLLDYIPVEEHDIKMNCIITEREIL